MKNMNVENFNDTINQFRQYGDAPRITKIVNEIRVRKGNKPLAASYIRAMLNGTRTLTSEVAEIAGKYYQVQESLNNISIQ
jgi:hypothetical protein